MLIYSSRNRRNRHVAHGGFAHKQKRGKAEPAPIAASDDESGQGAQAQGLDGLLLDGFFKDAETSRNGFAFSHFFHLSIPKSVGQIHRQLH
jgi:hypothetical protein